MTVYNISAMADRILYLKEQGQDEQQARDTVMKEFRVNSIPQEVEEKMNQVMQQPSEENKFYRNDKDNLVNRSETTTTFDLGSEKVEADQQQPEVKAGKKQQQEQGMNSPDSF